MVLSEEIEACMGGGERSGNVEIGGVVVGQWERVSNEGRAVEVSGGDVGSGRGAARME